MLNGRRQTSRSLSWSRKAQVATPKPRREASEPATVPAKTPALRRAGGNHPLAKRDENARLYDYERRVKDTFDSIVATLKRISALQHEENFEALAQRIAVEQLGYELPEQILAAAWVDQLDMRKLYAWCVFESYKRFCDDFFMNDLIRQEKEFQSFLQDCGFHTLDLSPCADGRLAHVISYVLRLPYKEVRRKSYAGALFEIDDSITKWVETEHRRYREGQPTTADAPTRYLKSVVYHFSSGNPSVEGCAAHGSDTNLAAQEGLNRLNGFQQAIQNSFCCGASIDLLLMGLDTDTDALRVHVPDESGTMDIENYLDTRELYEQTLSMNAQQAEDFIAEQVRAINPMAVDGMVQLITQLIVNNFSQIEYVQQYHGASYPDIGHAERFIGAGIGFEEVQLRNLTYFAYMHTVEEAAADLDVGIKIFTGLNVSQGLPVPIIVRFDYHGHVPGAKDRAIENCNRVALALQDRYEELFNSGLLHTLQVIRDCHAGDVIEILESSVISETQETH